RRELVAAAVAPTHPPKGPSRRTADRTRTATTAGRRTRRPPLTDRQQLRTCAPTPRDGVETLINARDGRNYCGAANAHRWFFMIRSVGGWGVPDERRHEFTRGLYGSITHTDLASADPVATRVWCESVLGWTFQEPFVTPQGDYHLFAYSDVGGG